MEQALALLSAIPAWVSALFGYGIYAGIRGFFPRRVSVFRLLLLPLVFLGLSLSSLAGVLAAEPLVGAAWALCVLAGVCLGWFYLTNEPLEVDRRRRTLVVPGSPVILFLFLTIFAVKFYYGFKAGTDPAGASQPLFLLTVFGFSGLSTGVVAGRTGKLYTDYLQIAEPRMG